MIQTELVDAVDVAAEQADDPLVRADVDLPVDLGLVVLHERVLPLVGFLERALQTNRL